MHEEQPGRARLYAVSDDRGAPGDIGRPTPVEPTVGRLQIIRTRA